MWDSDAKELQKAIEGAIGPEAMEYEIRFQPMFGGILGYTFERPFASLSHAGLALKLSPDDKAKLIDKEGGYPLRYKPDDPPSKGYTVLPKNIVDGDHLKEWLVISMNFCKGLPLKKKAKRKKP